MPNLIISKNNINFTNKNKNLFNILQVSMCTIGLNKDSFEYKKLAKILPANSKNLDKLASTILPFSYLSFKKATALAQIEADIESKKLYTKGQ